MASAEAGRAIRMIESMGTYSAKPGDIEKSWSLIDADGLVLGRLAAISPTGCAASTSRPSPRTWIAATTSSSSTPSKVALTGKKRADKIYHWHTGYPGGIKERTRREDPRRQASRAGAGEGRRAHGAARALGRDVHANLHVYAGAEHPHAGTEPVQLDSPP